MEFHQHEVNRDHEEEDRRQDRDVERVQAVEQRDAAELGGEPVAEASEEPAELDVVLEGLEGLLIPLQDGSGEEEDRRDPGEGHPDDPVALARPLERARREHP